MQSTLAFNYAAVGATATEPPSGYVVDHTRVQLGDGEQVFANAKRKLQRWKQFDLDWV